MHIKRNTAHNIEELIKLGFIATVVFYAFLKNVTKNSNHQNNNTNIFAFIYLF